MIFKNFKKIVKTIKNKFLFLFVNKKTKKEQVKEKTKQEVKKISKIKQLKK
jgi:hypothetical protein